MWLAQNPPASFLAAVCMGLLLDDAGDLFCETQGPNLFTQKTLTTRTHPPAPGAGLHPCRIRSRAVPAPCLIPSLPTWLPIPQIKKELVVSFRFSRAGITSPYDSCTEMHSVSRFCAVETPGMRAGLWKEPCLFAHQADVRRAHHRPAACA